MLRQKALLVKRIQNFKSSICQDDVMCLNLIIVYYIESIKRKTDQTIWKIRQSPQHLWQILTHIYQ